MPRFEHFSIALESDSNQICFKTEISFENG